MNDCLSLVTQTCVNDRGKATFKCNAYNEIYSCNSLNVHNGLMTA